MAKRTQKIYEITLAGGQVLRVTNRQRLALMRAIKARLADPWDGPVTISV